MCCHRELFLTEKRCANFRSHSVFFSIGLPADELVVFDIHREIRSRRGILFDDLSAEQRFHLALDEAEVPETGRVILVTPATYVLMKQDTNITMETDIGNDLRLKGVIGMLDGATVVKVPANRLPENFGFMVAHPCATVAPTKLADYKIHEDPPGISGSLVEGRINYDAFVLDNKVKAIYYQANQATE